MAGEAYGHVPVLAGPALEWLRVKPEGLYVDCTAGAGGHAELIAQRLAGGRLIALDRDPGAVAAVRRRLAQYPNVTVVHANYGELETVLAPLGVAQVDGVLLDVGVSSVQLDDPARGFSFQVPGPLDMRMDTTSVLDAAGYLAQATEDGLVEVLRSYGDVRPARRIARALIARRNAGCLNSTRDVVEAVQEALNISGHVPEEVRTVFQALRMAVNEELKWLEAGIAQALGLLAPDGRLVVIAFHSGEDRVVKQAFAWAARRQRLFHADGRVKTVLEPAFKLLTPKPVVADPDEVRRNPRAKSAKLRAIERIARGAETVS
ncbi:MAG: 16S rRNA (cytosine(1402)-N(4))-methyltransferase RsmH [Candidatus Hydrogenedentes bacterium]|nr:16S rRNA (cytosine(1402)-N(4))-methyltransferase RsmH [Candidatus Hydrogenedentota bacterium]